MKKFAFIFISIALSVIVLLVATEVALHFSGWIFLKTRAYKNERRLANHNDARIMCIGESTTALGGDDSYPSQLQKLLNEHFPSAKISVLNQGVPGQGSAYILEHIKEWLSQYSPQMAIIMMGINDERHLAPIDEAVGIKSAFHSLRVYKLYLWIKKSIAQNPHFASSSSSPSSNTTETFDKFKDIRPMIAVEKLLAAKKYAPAETILLHYWEKAPEGEAYVYLLKKLIFIYEQTRQYKKLANIFKNHLGGRLKSANDYLIGDAIETVCPDPLGTKAITEMLNEIIKELPDQPGFYALLSSCYQKAGQESLATRFQSTADNLYSSLIDPVIIERYVELITILHERGIKIVVMSYPRRSVIPLKTALAKLLPIADIAFIDNKENFENALSHSPYPDYFADRFAVNFGHCTAKGNKLIAENLFTYLSEQLQ